MSKYWYFITIHTCPVCGRQKTYRERKYNEKPMNMENRYELEDIYDHCED